MFKLKTADKETDGTSYHGITIKATANELMILAENNGCEYIDNAGDVYEKSQYDFGFITPEGVVFTVYDWKEYRQFSVHEILRWHIGGHTEMASRVGLKELRKQLEYVRDYQS